MPGKRFLPLPTFEQAGRFAQIVGCKTELEWVHYTAGMTREDLFQRVLSVINARVTLAKLEN